MFFLIFSLKLIITFILPAETGPGRHTIHPTSGDKFKFHIARRSKFVECDLI